LSSGRRFVPAWRRPARLRFPLPSKRSRALSKRNLILLLPYLRGVAYSGFAIGDDPARPRSLNPRPRAGSRFRNSPVSLAQRVGAIPLSGLSARLRGPDVISITERRRGRALRSETFLHHNDLNGSRTWNRPRSTQLVLRAGAFRGGRRRPARPLSLMSTSGGRALSEPAPSPACLIGRFPMRLRTASSQFPN
jgi:hypothetical protein